MINTLTFSICVSFQTSSKKACEKNKQLDNLTKQRSLSAGDTSTISEENWIKKRITSSKKLVKNIKNGHFNLTKQKASSEGETFTISEENCNTKKCGLCYLITIYNLFYNI